MWYVSLIVFMYGQYVPQIIVQPFPTEEACRNAAIKTGLPEFPPAGTPFQQIPGKSWSCTSGK